MIARSIIVAACFLVAGCATSQRDLPLTTPETFESGLQRIDSMLTHGKFDEARDYVERHKSTQPVIYWAFQVHLNDTVFDHSRRRQDTMHSYEEFFKAYQDKYMDKPKGIQPTNTQYQSPPSQVQKR